MHFLCAAPCFCRAGTTSCLLVGSLMGAGCLGFGAVAVHSIATSTGKGCVVNLQSGTFGGM